MKSKFKKLLTSAGVRVIEAFVLAVIILFSIEVLAQPQPTELEKVKKVLPLLPYSMVRFEADKLSLMEPKPCRCRPCCGTFEMWQSYYVPVTNEKMSLLTEINLK